jgi:hypothetical protein
LAWEHASWASFTPTDTEKHPEGYLDPFEAGIRTSGHLGYDGWDELGPHKDNDSLYTALIALSHPMEYEGGELFMVVDRTGDESDPHRKFDKAHPPLMFKPNQFDAVVFMADENTHKVQTIYSGNRQTIGTEFWEYEDAPFGIMRPSPAMHKNFQRNGDWWNYD